MKTFIFYKKISNTFLFVIICTLFISCSNHTADTANNNEHINIMLDSFNEAAAKADFNKYFSYFDDDAVFIGTDATERWDKKSYMAWAKPHFDKGKTWSFKSLERHIYFNKEGSFAWFDELLNTRMKICRGSGVLIKKGNEWKILQYVLSMTIPNENTDTIIKIKTDMEDNIIMKLSD
jgi:hypothetical protein